MVFSGIPFLYYFLPAVLLLYAAVPRKYKNAVLLFSSLIFYAWGEQLLVLLFITAILTGYASGLLLENIQKPGKRKAVLVISLVIDLGLLCWFKYADFFIENLNGLLNTSLPLANIALPIGISFYTFQLISYTVDVYRGNVRAQHNLIDFAAYISMFPQLIAGPIVRYADVEKQLTDRTHTLDKTAAGITRFLTGLAKKVLIANVLGGLAASFKASTDLSVLYYWLYAVSYSLQIYFDFSGYSDMAIGLGKLFGFDFPENFDHPYISTSITEFWRRWHMTLGSWFRDYIYIPLGGNRRGIFRQLLNILTVWMLTGLWHGASWNFVLWGLYFAVLLTVEKLGFKKWLDRHRIIGHAYVLLAVILSFTIFDAASLSDIPAALAGLFGLSGLPFASKEALYMLRSFAFVLILAAVFSTPVLQKLAKSFSKTRKRAVRAYPQENAESRELTAPVQTEETESMILALCVPVILTGLLILSTAYLADGSFNPFLYFRF